MPPSLNAEKGQHWSRFHRTKQRWQGILAGLLLVGGVPRECDRVYAEASLRFPQHRRRDEGNFRWMLEKALGDALVAGRWLDDDTGGKFSTGPVTFEAERGPVRTRLKLTYWKE